MTKGGIRRVLVIDDDPDMLALAGVALSDFGGLTTILCETAEDALAQLDDVEPDAILLDLFLPETDAQDTLARIRARPDTRETPVVILTAQLDDALIEPLDDWQLAGIIRKPFEPETLTRQLVELCGVPGKTGSPDPTIRPRSRVSGNADAGGREQPP